MHSGIHFPASPLAWHRHVLWLAVPIILANLTQPLLGLVDTAIAGHLPDAAALGGVALGALVFSLLFWAFGFLRMGTSALTAQAHGAGDGQALRAGLVRAMIVAWLIGLTLVACQGPLLATLIELLQASDAVQAQALAYSHARIWSAPFALSNYVILGYLLGIQQVRAALVLQVVINLVNVVLVVVFVHGLDAGVAGIGAATAIADIVGMGAGLWWLHRVRLRSLGPLQLGELAGLRALGRLFAINVSLLVRTLCLLLCFGWFARAGAQQGDTILAANAVLLNFQTFMAYALDGLAHAAETLVGAAVGARHRQALRSAIMTAFIWSVLGALAFTAVYASLGGPIIEALTDKQDVVTMAREFLPWVIILPLASVVGFLLDGVFIGATRTRDLMTTMVICAGLFLTVALLLIPRFGNHGLWAALVVLMAARGAGLTLRLPRLIESVPMRMPQPLVGAGTQTHGASVREVDPPQAGREAGVESPVEVLDMDWRRQAREEAARRTARENRPRPWDGYGEVEDIQPQ